MLVLADSEWAGCFAPSRCGDIVVVQPFGFDGDLEVLVARVTATPASETLRFSLVDRRLRLLPGADDGSGGLYGFADADVTPGEKVCEAWTLPEAQVVVLRDSGAVRRAD